MEMEEQRLECLKLAIDYVKYTAQFTKDNRYYTISGIISIASEFHEFISQ